jgi:hypothetical protein
MRHQKSGFARMLAAVALLAMVVRALVPAGYMFAPDRGGDVLTVTLCSGHGAVAAVIDLQTGAVVDADAAPDDQSPGKSSNANAPCVFASVATLAAPEAPVTVTVALQMAPAETIASVRAAPGRGLAAPPPWSTGPPLTA